MKSILKFLSFFIKTSSQSKESPLSKQSLPFQKKYFIPTLIATLQELNPPPPLVKGGGLEVR